MTGIMVSPVQVTSRRSIVPVLVEEARAAQAQVAVLHVRELGIPVLGMGVMRDAEDDPNACAIFTEALADGRRLGVPVRLVYLIGGGVADRIVQAAAELDASRVSMQLPTRVGVSRFFGGDVIGRVAEQLPAAREMVIRA